MLAKPIILILISVLLGASGQILMKYGTMRVETNADDSAFDLLLKYFTNISVLGGVGLYALSAITWIFALSKVQLSYAYPMVALGYVVVVAASYFIFGDSISVMRVAGLLAIVIGVILISQS